jgi:hypothetical protein
MSPAHRSPPRFACIPAANYYLAARAQLSRERHRLIPMLKDAEPASATTV